MTAYEKQYYLNELKNRAHIHRQMARVHRDRRQFALAEHDEIRAHELETFSYDLRHERIMSTPELMDAQT